MASHVPSRIDVLRPDNWFRNRKLSAHRREGVWGVTMSACRPIGTRRNFDGADGLKRSLLYVSEIRIV